MSQSSTTRLVVVLAIAGFASTFALRSVEPLVDVLARDLRSDARTVALLSSAFALPYALIQPILGPIGDAWGKERVLMGCLCVLTIALLGSAFASDLDPLFVLRALGGAAAGGVIPLALAMMGDRIPMDRRQVEISRFLVAVILGQLMGSTVAGLLEAQIGWRGVFGLTAAVAALGCGTTLFGFEAARRTPAQRLELGRALARYRAIVALPRARVLFTAVFVEAIAIFGVFPYLAPLFAARGEGGPREAGLALAGFAVGGLFYSLSVSLLLRFLGIHRMLVAGGLVCAVALFVVGLGGSWQLDFAALLAMGFGFYMLHNTFQVQVTELAPGARGSAVALHAFSYFCGQALGVAVVGAALQSLGQLPALGLCAVTILLVGIVAASQLSRPERSHQLH